MAEKIQEYGAERIDNIVNIGMEEACTEAEAVTADAAAEDVDLEDGDDFDEDGFGDGGAAAEQYEHFAITVDR